MPLLGTLRRTPWDIVVLVLLAASLRLALLDTKQPHFDEGVNGWFADRLRETGTFVYTPENFHGPWHFYTVFVSQEWFGRNVWALRLPVVLASVLTVPVFFLFARWFGRGASRWAAAAFAVSPACVFYGRYSIHEPWFALFTAIFTWGCIALWLERSRSGLWSAALGLTGMILNKETYIIHAGTLALAAAVFHGWSRIFPVQPPVERPAERGWKPGDAWGATVVCIFLLVFFYSGNFMHPAGLPGMFEALWAWTQTGTAGNGHEKAAYDLLPFVNYYWLALLARYEWPALAGLLWSVRYASPAPAAPRLLAVFGAGVLAAYSIVAYKTPWCMASIIWPWFLFFGAAVTAIKSRWAWTAGVALLAVSLGMTVRLNFFRYENDAEPYVYVQTYRSLEHFTGPLLALAATDPRWLQTPGAIYLESYYPLPWILGDFRSIGYHAGNIPAVLPNAEFHVIETAKADELRKRLPVGFEETRFLLRSGVGECSVFFSHRFMEAFERLSPVSSPHVDKP
ncbi:MAG: glycosyltransferase family 39 protein [Chthoniobacterales bacterium]|nr:glycosyltransferase family 39 protein [Chthoniobacterales bacterium]